MCPKEVWHSYRSQEVQNRRILFQQTNVTNPTASPANNKPMGRQKKEKKEEKPPQSNPYRAVETGLFPLP